MAGILAIKNMNTALQTKPKFTLIGCVCVYLILVTGLAMGQPIEILSSDLRGAVQPQTAASPNGNVFVTFGKGDLVYCVTSTNGGKSFLPAAEVGSLPKLALGMRRGPRIVASDGQVTISAISHADGNLYSWTSSDTGVTWSQPVKMNSADNAVREGLHGMASDGRGKVFAVWLDLRSKGTQLWGVSSGDGGKSWGKDLVVYQSPDGHICECCHPSVTVMENGAIRVMWRNWLGGSRDMFATVSTDEGKTFPAAEKLGTGTWLLNGCPMDGGSLAGSYSTWRRGGAVYFTDNQSGEHLLADGRQPIVVVKNDAPYFVWQEGSRLMMNKGTVVKPIVLAESGAYPVMATGTKDLGPIVVWESATNGVQTILAEILH